MANQEHLAILRQGVAIWNQWRIENPEEKLDFSGAELKGADLIKADITASPFKSYLSDADLSNADLSNADLSNADLSDANLSGADLMGANLSGADLSTANLMGAELFNANLSEADLIKADLRRANLSKADLMGADLSLANLSRANLSTANLSTANLSGAVIGETILANVDLSEVKGLESVGHVRPSSIGIDTIYRSKGNIPHKFLLDAGVPGDDIAYLLSLAGKAIDFYSCFISYSERDRTFAKRLHADLQAKGIRTWYAPEDLTIGEPFLLGIDKGIQLHDKLLLVLSENSVTSGWVQHEVLSALAKEQGKEPWVLFPVRLDETVMHTNVPWVNMIRQSRHIGDFTHWKDHDTYQKAFDRLLRDLKMGEKG